MYGSYILLATISYYYMHVYTRAGAHDMRSTWPVSHGPQGHDPPGYAKVTTLSRSHKAWGVPLFLFDMPGGYATQGGKYYATINRYPHPRILSPPNIYLSPPRLS